MLIKANITCCCETLPVYIYVLASLRNVAAGHYHDTLVKQVNSAQTAICIYSPDFFLCRQGFVFVVSQKCIAD